MADLMIWLGMLANDPIVYVVIFFLFCVAAAIILPIPVELGLFLGTAVPYPVLAIVLGLGKAVGSLFVFEVGVKVEPRIRRWSAKYRLVGKFIKLAEEFVSRYRYYALYILLSIPFMSDTVVLYLFSLLNREGTAMGMKWFAITNFLAGVTRAAILALLLYVFGIDLFG